MRSDIGQTRLTRHTGPAAVLGAVAIAMSVSLLITAGADSARTAGGMCPSWAATLPPPEPATPSIAPRPAVHPGTATTRASVAAPSSGTRNAVAVGATRASIGARVPLGSGSAVLIQYGRGLHYTACSAVQTPDTLGSNVVDVLLKGLQPDAVYHFRIIARTTAGAVPGTDRTFRTLPGGYVPQGVKVGSIEIGGMTRTDARAALEQSVAAPLRLSYAGAYWQASRAEAGARLDTKRALAGALTASPGALLPPLRISLDASQLRGYVASLARRWNRERQPAQVHLSGTRALVTPAQDTVSVETEKTAALIGRAITSGSRDVIPLAVVRQAPTTSPTPAQRAVVIRLGAQTLTAYLNGQPVLETPVTTGRPALPTPVGSYTIHFRASPYTFVSPWPPGSPYWYPPTPVTWAMYFFDNDFLHDDPGEPAAHTAPAPSTAPTQATAASTSPTPRWRSSITGSRSERRSSSPRPELRA